MYYWCTTLADTFLLRHIMQYIQTANPAGTQRSKIVRWSYFGGDVQDHNWTKIGCNRVLIYFRSATPNIQLESEKIEKIQ